MGFLFLPIIGLILCSIAFAKNKITYKNYQIIIDAIYQYYDEIIDNGGRPDFSLYEKMESYDATFWRIFDWSYENILPSDEMEKLRPYINKR